MIAHRNADERGAGTIEPEDLLAGFIVEDQGGFGKELSRLAKRPDVSVDTDSPRRRSFLSAGTASDLLARLQVPHSGSRPDSSALELPVSAGVQRIFSEASGLRKDLQHDSVEPLHLLAAILDSGDSRAAQMLFAVGITRAGVLEAIQGEAEALEDAPSAPDPFAPSPSWGRATVLHALAKVRAWARGAPSVKTEDMFVAIIIEDQPALAEAFPEIHGYPGLLATLEAGTHAPFFSLDLARRLLDGLAAVQSSYAEEESREPRNRTVGIASPELLLRPPPPSVLVPMSDPVNRCFMAADRLRVHLGRTELQPLHLLAALVEDPSSRGAQLFHDAGVTRDSVLRAARGEAS